MCGASRLMVKESWRLPESLGSFLIFVICLNMIAMVFNMPSIGLNECDCECGFHMILNVGFCMISFLSFESFVEILSIIIIIFNSHY